MQILLPLAVLLLILTLVWTGATYVMTQVGRLTGHPPRRAARRGRSVPISATHLPV